MTTTFKGTVWKVKNSLWILFTFTIIFNWIAFFIIGYKVKHKKWSIYGAIYSIPFILLMAIGERYDMNQWQWDLIGYSLIGGAITSIIHAFRIRKEYLYRLEAIKLRQPMEDQKLRGQIEAEYGVRYNQAPPKVQQQQPAAQQNHPKEPQQEIAPASRIVEATPIQKESPKMDLNQATEQELAELPGVGPILAKKAIKERENIGSFHSLEEFAELLSLKPHIVEKIRPLVIVTHKNDSPKQQWAGRMVDF
nr:helix-hairpin-helix domain-containing protein [Neobacillus sp. Marseille-Q6967]